QRDGDVAVVSAPGSGARFEVYLPALAAVDAVDGDAPGVARVRGGRETILLVEDEAALRRLARRALEGLGYAVLEARDAAQALSIVKAHDGTIDLLLTDVVMPGTNGAMLADLVRAIRPMKVLFMSGYTDH